MMENSSAVISRIGCNCPENEKIFTECEHAKKLHHSYIICESEDMSNLWDTKPHTSATASKAEFLI